MTKRRIEGVLVVLIVIVVIMILVKEERKADIEPKQKVIAWSINLIRDEKDSKYLDGAAVLKESVLRVQSDYKQVFVALVAPEVSPRSRYQLERLGFQVLEKQLPIIPENIKGKLLYEKWTKDLTKSGCCGAWELLKLYAWTLTEYHRVIQVDTDCILLQSIDELFELNYDFIYTADYNMMSAKQLETRIPPAVQGGFLVVRPSLKVYNELQIIAQNGYWNSRGWENSGIGYWWGGPTIQGLLPYYFHAFNATSLEINRCIYNNMIDKQVSNPLVGSPACRHTPFSHIKFIHFTVCQKPWSCHPNRDPDDSQNLCLQAHNKWFDLRHLMETNESTKASIQNHPCLSPKRKSLAGPYRPIDFDRLFLRLSSLPLPPPR